jgi:hypothetical protein
MTNAYASCQTFEDSGLIHEVKIEFGETNTSAVNFHIQFVRGRAYRLELHSERKGGAGPYSLIYFWDGRTWSSYKSLHTYILADPVNTNETDSGILGSGTAISYGLVPGNPRLLHLKEGVFSGFRLYDSAEVKVDLLQGRPVYRLTLHLAIATDKDTDDYWIDPRTYMILQERLYSIDRSDDEVDTTRRETSHSPKVDALRRDQAIEFGAPAWTPPVISYSGGDGSSPEQAIIITIQGLTHMGAAIPAELKWSREKYPGVDWDDHSKVSKGGKRYDVMRFTLANGESKTVYFDVTGFSDE